jgi:hypothetical protein
MVGWLAEDRAVANAAMVIRAAAVEMKAAFKARLNRSL